MRLAGVRVALVLGCVFFCAVRSPAAQIIDDGPCGIPPPPKPKRIKGGEGVPPLPLPATPLRRTERKRDPSPPVLIGKVVWGENRSLQLEDGRTIQYADWNLDPNDAHRLLGMARRKLGIHYRTTPVRLESFSYDHLRVPILYVTGVRALRFAPEIRDRIRDYCDRGGFLLADACRGSRLFAAAMRDEFQAMFPDRPLRLLPPDHAVYAAFRRLDQVRYSPAVTDRPEGAPYLEGVYRGCRTIAVLSPYGLSCAWDSDHIRPGARCVVGHDAHDMGLNLLSYALATFDLAQFYARGGLKEPVIVLPTQAAPAAAATGGFVFAQLLHEGHADPDPTAFARLLETVTANTAVGLTFRRKLVRPEDPALGTYPFLYITGHDDFCLSKEGAAALRQHLMAGGFLLADACCGALSFAAAFRREMRRVMPGAPLEPLPAEHPVYTSFYKLETADLTPKAQATYSDLRIPYLEGVTVDGTVRVPPSRFPLDLGNGWEGVPHPYARGYRERCALRIGVNAILYALSH